jgi:N-acetylglucosamine kinase-like BadF-type ATPase
MSLFLGVDGGGTKTEFVAIDAAGQVVARTVTGTTYHLQVGFDEAMRRLAEGVATIAGQTGVAARDFDYVFLGLPAFGEDAGIDPRIVAACGRLLGHDRYRCDNDMVCGWAGSLACEDGINVVAGTGSIAYGQRAGRAARAGGWGEVFGDEGSAYWIAVQGLALFSRMSDGRAPRGPLYGIVAEALALGDDLDLCARVMGPAGLGRDGIAALAPLVSQAARAGDVAAHDILRLAARELVALATAARAVLGFDCAAGVPVSWSGGVLLNEPLVREEFVARLGNAFAPAPPLYPPGQGAALYARLLAQR